MKGAKTHASFEKAPVEEGSNEYTTEKRKVLSMYAIFCSDLQSHYHLWDFIASVFFLYDTYNIL
jgi:hypothetical protein